VLAHCRLRGLKGLVGLQRPREAVRKRRKGEACERPSVDAIGHGRPNEFVQVDGVGLAGGEKVERLDRRDVIDAPEDEAAVGQTLAEEFGRAGVGTDDARSRRGAGRDRPP
jgi:hypothetical protein